MTKKTRYQLIDKRIITEGEILDFSLYYPNEAKNGMILLIANGENVTGDMKVTLRSLEKLYVKESERTEYQHYLDTHIQHIASRNDIPTEEKAAIVYEKQPR